MTRAHLDLVGGIAGDMFIAAVLDVRPELYEGMCSAIRAAGLPDIVGMEVREYSDKILTGTYFHVDEAAVEDHHHHTLYRQIKEMLEQSPLSEEVTKIAIAIFTRLAEAEAQVHGKTVDTISFHEVGEWDSIADIVGAAFLIHQLDAQWTVGLLPLGHGRVKTSHGELPVPTPATVILLEGFEFYDDGIGGERITPTGAAILNYLKPTQQGVMPAGTLAGSGIGFGTRTLTGKSNVVRLLVLTGKSDHDGDTVIQIEFDIDDQSPEDLAIGLDHIRAIDTVLDVVQTSFTGKKNRIGITVRVLAQVDRVDEVFRACFLETTTIGLRYQTLRRVTLSREQTTVNVDGHMVDIKLVSRADDDQWDGKVEVSSLEGVRGHREREAIRREALVESSNEQLK